MQDSVFTKIIRGDIPCHKIYEDSRTFAFMDIHPLLPGHVLVVPKTQVDHFDELSPADYQAVFSTVRKVAKQIKTVLGAKRAIIQVLGFDVPHAHVHVMTGETSQQYFEAAAAHLQGTHHYQPSDEELAELAQKLRLPDDL